MCSYSLKYSGMILLNKLLSTFLPIPPHSLTPLLPPSLPPSLPLFLIFSLTPSLPPSLFHSLPSSLLCSCMYVCTLIVERTAIISSFPYNHTSTSTVFDSTPLPVIDSVKYSPETLTLYLNMTPAATTVVPGVPAMKTKSPLGNRSTSGATRRGHQGEGKGGEGGGGGGGG